MAQVACNLTDAFDGFLNGRRFLICDSDSCFAAEFRRILEETGVHVVRTPHQAPNCNAYAERFVLSIKSECLNWMVLFGESSLCGAVDEYVAHYHAERAHQELGNERIEDAVAGEGRIQCRKRLGGILKSHYRAA
jgi:transposase InsO family protein